MDSIPKNFHPSKGPNKWSLHVEKLIKWIQMKWTKAEIKTLTQKVKKIHQLEINSLRININKLVSQILQILCRRILNSLKKFKTYLVIWVSNQTSLVKVEISIETRLRLGRTRLILIYWWLLRAIKLVGPLIKQL